MVFFGEFRELLRSFRRFSRFLNLLGFCLWVKRDGPGYRNFSVGKSHKPGFATTGSLEIFGIKVGTVLIDSCMHKNFGVGKVKNMQLVFPI